MTHRYDNHKILLNNIKSNLDKLKAMHTEISDEWISEDLIYRFYHHSFKVYWLQDTTTRIVEILKLMLPEEELNESFVGIVNAGTNKKFKLDDNAHWDEITRPIIEAFFHAKFFLEMAVKYGEKLETDPTLLPSGWAALLYLYNIR